MVVSCSRWPGKGLLGGHGHLLRWLLEAGGSRSASLRTRSCCPA